MFLAANVRLSIWQRLKLRISGRVYLGRFIEPGWHASLPYYAFKCKTHGIVADRSHGWSGCLNCPKCFPRPVARNSYPCVCWICLAVVNEDPAFIGLARENLALFSAKIGSELPEHSCEDPLHCGCNGNHILPSKFSCRYCLARLESEEELLSGLCILCVQQFASFSLREVV